MAQTTKQERKIKAVELMKKLDIYSPYIDGFESKDYVCLFDEYDGYGAYHYPELIEKKNEIENTYGCTCYAITHERTECGEMHSFLVVPKDSDDWDYIFDKTQYGNVVYVFAYVWNKDEELFSEFGDVAVHLFGGGIRRVG